MPAVPVQVTIKGRPVTGLPANWQEDIRLGSERAEVTGTALGIDEAAARFLSRYRIVCACFIVFVWLVLYAMLAFAQPGDRAFLVPFGLIMAALTPLAF